MAGREGRAGRNSRNNEDLEVSPVLNSTDEFEGDDDDDFSDYDPDVEDLNDPDVTTLPEPPLLGGRGGPGIIFGSEADSFGRASGSRMYASASQFPTAVQFRVWKIDNGQPMGLGVIDIEASEEDFIRTFYDAMPRPGEGKCRFTLRPIDIRNHELGKEITKIISEHHVTLKTIREMKKQEEQGMQGWGGYGYGRGPGGGDIIVQGGGNGAGEAAMTYAEEMGRMFEQAQEASEERTKMLQETLELERERQRQEEKERVNERVSMAERSANVVQQMTEKLMSTDRLRSDEAMKAQQQHSQLLLSTITTVFQQQQEAARQQAERMREADLARAATDREFFERQRQESELRRQREREDNDEKRRREQADWERRRDEERERMSMEYKRMEMESQRREQELERRRQQEKEESQQRMEQLRLEAETRRQTEAQEWERRRQQEVDERERRDREARERWEREKLEWERKENARREEMRIEAERRREEMQREDARRREELERARLEWDRRREDERKEAERKEQARREEMARQEQTRREEAERTENRRREEITLQMKQMEMQAEKDRQHAERMMEMARQEREQQRESQIIRERMEREAREHQEKERDRQHQMAMREMEMNKERDREHQERMLQLQKIQGSGIGGLTEMLGMETPELLARIFGAGDGESESWVDSLPKMVGSLAELGKVAMAQSDGSRVTGRRPLPSTGQTPMAIVQGPNGPTAIPVGALPPPQHIPTPQMGAMPQPALRPDQELPNAGFTPDGVPTSAAPPRPEVIDTEGTPVPKSDFEAAKEVNTLARAKDGGVSLTDQKKARKALRSLRDALESSEEDEWLGIITEAITKEISIYHYIKAISVYAAFVETGADEGMCERVIAAMKNSGLVPDDIAYNETQFAALQKGA